MADMMIVLALVCVLGILTGEIPIGIIFIASLIIILWTILVLIEKKKLKESGMIVTIIGALSLVYAICILFLHIDVWSVLRLDMFMAEIKF